MEKTYRAGEHVACPYCHKVKWPDIGCMVSKIRIGDEIFSRIKADTPMDCRQGLRDQVCHDCKVKTGQYHHYGCGMEVCPHCAAQLISCHCNEVYIMEIG